MIKIKWRRRCAASVFCAAAIALLPASARAAEAYPTKPIRIIVPSSPSSGPDVVTRLIGSVFTETWGQQVVADNRAGSAGNIGAEIAARATPDGYTLFMGSSQQITGPLVFDKLQYSLIRDFVPISLVASTPYALIVNPSVPANSIREFIAHAKSRATPLYYGTGGVGGAPHLATEMLRTMAGLELVHVPYKTIVFALIDTMAGQVQFSFSVLPAALPMVKQGKLRALGVTSLKRSSLAPELEAIAETIPGYDIIGWYGLMAPQKTAPAIVAALNTTILKSLKSPEMQEKIRLLGADPIGTSPQEFGRFLVEQNEKFRKLIDAAGLRNKAGG
jgi:tripartite-type tricarboxylate transporter receptor subunit TctC